MANLALPSSDNSVPGRLRDWRGSRQHVGLYALSLSLVAIAFVLRALLAPTLGEQALYLFLVPPVLVAGVLGGWGPGVLATVTETGALVVTRPVLSVTFAVRLWLPLASAPVAKVQAPLLVAIAVPS